MEYASFLAGEPWSDHPKCTHPLIAAIARGVNDHISDEGRSKLVTLIPSVVGLTDDDIRVEVGIAVRCASTALPVVAEHRQRGLAVGLLAARRILAEHNGGSRSTVDASELLEEITRALAGVPHAARWAEEFTAGSHPSPRSFQRRSAPAITRLAITGIAEACIPDRDNLLFELLTGVVEDCTRWLGSTLPTESAVQLLVSVGPTD